MKAVETVDDYIAQQPAAARAVLVQVRALLRRALPRASEGIAYRMPAYVIEGAPVLYFAGFKQHFSLFPASRQLIAALGTQLDPYLNARATLRFAYDAALPARLITRIAKLRAAEVRAARPARPASRRSARSSTKRARPASRKRAASR